jgi:hypothetical protein
MHLLISASTFSIAVKSSFMVMPYSSLPGIGPAEVEGRAPRQADRNISKKISDKNKPVLRNANKEPISNKLFGFIVFLLIKNSPV